MTMGVGLELQPTIVKPGVPTSLLPALLILSCPKEFKIISYIWTYVIMRFDV